MEEKYDFFDGEAPEEKKEKVETPEQKTEREIANDTIEVNRSKFRKILYGIIAAVIVFFTIWTWLHFYHPITSEAQRSGGIKEVKCVGLIFKTYEGQMISEEMLADPARTIYQSDFTFSIDNDSIAKALMALQGKGKKVTVTYEEYKGSLPWRGSTSRIVTGYEVMP